MRGNKKTTTNVVDTICAVDVCYVITFSIKSQAQIFNPADFCVFLHSYFITINQ